MTLMSSCFTGHSPSSRSLLPVVYVPWARAISRGRAYRFLLFHFMWFLRGKRESAGPCSSVSKKTPLLDPVPVPRSSV